MPGYSLDVPASPEILLSYDYHLLLTTPNLLASSIGTGIVCYGYIPHCSPCGNQASLHNPSYKYDPLIKLAHSPDYMIPYNLNSGKLRLLFLYTILYFHFFHMVEVLVTPPIFLSKSHGIPIPI